MLLLNTSLLLLVDRHALTHLVSSSVHMFVSINAVTGERRMVEKGKPARGPLLPRIDWVASDRFDTNQRFTNHRIISESDDLLFFARFNIFLAFGQRFKLNLAHQLGRRQRNDVLGWQTGDAHRLLFLPELIVPLHVLEQFGNLSKRCANNRWNVRCGLCVMSKQKPANHLCREKLMARNRTNKKKKTKEEWK